MNSTLESLQANISLVTTDLLPNGLTQAKITVQSNGLLISGAYVKWVASSGSRYVSAQNETDSNGVATAVIEGGLLAGSFQVQAVVQKAGFTDYLASTGLTVSLPVAAKSPASMRNSSRYQSGPGS